MNRGKQAAAASDLAVCIVGPCEGIRHYVYTDPVGIPTYCFGETRNPVLGKSYTTAECNALLTDRTQEAVEMVQQCAPDAPVDVLAAFGSAVYNMGPTIACDVDRSTAARLLKAGEWPRACDQLLRWNKATLPGGAMVTLPGLTKRRMLERETCLKMDAAPAEEIPNA